MSKWADEEKDWIQIMLRHPPRKEDVTVDLLKMMRQPTAHPKPRGGRSPEKKNPDNFTSWYQRRQQNSGGLAQRSCQAVGARLYCCGRSKSNVEVVEQEYLLAATRRRLGGTCLS